MRADRVLLGSQLFQRASEVVLHGTAADPRALLGQTLRSFLQASTAAQEAVDEEAAVERPPLVLILDQFEEIFTTHHDRLADVEGFFWQMREALDALPDLGMVLTMREDHVAALDPYVPAFPRRLP